MDLEKIFHLKENKTDVKTEVIAGITTFMTMAYILAVNPSVLSACGMDSGAVFTATALAALIATLLMAAFSNYPFVLAPGMGLNAYFSYTVVLQMGYSWQTALAAVFIEGIVFILLSLTNVREAIFNAIPMNLKHAVSVGIGLFIAFIGLQNAHIVVDSATLVGVYSFKSSVENGLFNSEGITVVLALVGILVTGILVVKGVKGNILWGILITWGLGILCQFLGIYQVNPEIGMYSLLPDFSNGISVPSLAPTLMQMDFSGILSLDFFVLGIYQVNPEIGMYSLLPDFSNGISVPSLAPTLMQMDFSGILSLDFFVVMFAFLFVDLFDTLGTLIGVASKADMLDKDGKLPRIRGALLSDAIGTSVGAMLGTSTTTTFVESASGVAEGGRTGLTAVVAAILFGLSLFLSPIFLAIPSFATAPALVVVGFLMLTSITKINFDDFTEAIPAYVAIIAMPFMYSISEGIAMGVISYVVINVVTGKMKEKKISPLMYVLAVLFIGKYIML